MIRYIDKGRGEPNQGQVAVGAVILNRVKSSKGKNTQYLRMQYRFQRKTASRDASLLTFYVPLFCSVIGR